MRNPSLTETDRALLDELRRRSRPADLPALADALGYSSERLAERVAFMVDNGLVREVDAGDEYELTENGNRVLRAPGDTHVDDAIDVPESVLGTLSARGLRADRLDAVVSAVEFLRYWGKATAAEIKDGVFSEVPMEFETAEAWWSEFVRDHLAAVPNIEPPETEGGFWRFTGTPGIADVSEDGRKVLFGRGAPVPGPYASATEAVSEMNLSDGERLAVSAALAALQRGEADDATLRDAAAAVATDDPSTDQWVETSLLDVLARLPGVVRGDGDRWRYTLTPDGYASPD